MLTLNLGIVDFAEENQPGVSVLRLEELVILCEACLSLLKSDSRFVDKAEACGGSFLKNDRINGMSVIAENTPPPPPPLPPLLLDGVAAVVVVDTVPMCTGRKYIPPSNNNCIIY